MQEVWGARRSKGRGVCRGRLADEALVAGRSVKEWGVPFLIITG